MNWHSFGDRGTFAIDLRYAPDPDRGRGADAPLSASWGAIRLWVNARNLCEHRAQGQLHDHVAWYLLPLLRWLVESWDPIFHEQRLPEPAESRGGARASYWNALRAVLGDDDPEVERRAEAWHSWWGRHAMRASREGGLFPDLFLRRVEDYVELSWGNRELPGMPADFYFTVPAGLTYRDVATVAQPLYQSISWALGELATAPGSEDVLALSRRSAALKETPFRTRTTWFVPSRVWSAIEGRAGRATGAAAQLFTTEDDALYVRRFAPAVAMFGAVSPEIGQTDIDQLLGELITAVAPGGDSRALEGLTQETRLSQAKLAHEEGYDLALQLLESLALPATGDTFVDIDAILMQLGVAVRDIALDEPTLRGVAFAGGDIHPTVLANTRHRMNTAPSGRRFTLAHELCHILHDRAYGQSLSMVSGPWAPAGVEQRANAFAAMLLMPYELINRLRALSPSVPLDSPEGVKELAGLMQTGFVATLEHLMNIGKLDAGQRERIRGDAFLETGI